MAKKKEDGVARVAADNRKARHDYFIEETLEAGVMLQGTEVKSLREGKANIAEAYATVENSEMLLINAYIPEYSAGNRNNHEPRRPRKLLLHRREIDRLKADVKRAGMTVVPLRLYFNDRGRVKIELGLAKGKRKEDKREADKDRTWKLEKARLLKERG
ncbi:MAG: SsrA-binding protein SmpB [Pseudomonadota bacterium]